LLFFGQQCPSQPHVDRNCLGHDATWPKRRRGQVPAHRRAGTLVDALTRDSRHCERVSRRKTSIIIINRAASIDWFAFGPPYQGRIAGYRICEDQSVSGNPGGSPEATRRAFNKRFLLDLAEDWQQHGREVFKRVRRESPASYLKVCAMLVPKEVKLEHSTSAIKAMTDEQIEQAIEAIQNMLAAQAGEATKVIEGTAEPAALPAPGAESMAAVLEPTPKRKPNRLMIEVDTAIGPRERISRKAPSSGA
jgi:hypothetical protein